MAFAGMDPTGGAGLQADIESIVSMGAYAAPIVTAVTIQDTQDLQGFMPLDTPSIVEQARAVLEDMPVAAFKVGMLGSVEAAEAVHTIIQDYPNVPVVVDPVLATGAGTLLADEDLIDALCELLIPLTTVFTPNSLEARTLAHEADTLEACAHELMDMGAEYVLVTGSHENTDEVINNLFHNNRKLQTYNWKRLPNNYHGSGCTLSASLAALLAHGEEPVSAVREAQEFTWEALAHGFRLGMGQWLPNRMYWANAEDHQHHDEQD
jgi:hydroxymethylpyrimidine/phosphomethylpyrimidine kinase